MFCLFYFRLKQLNKKDEKKKMSSVSSEYDEGFSSKFVVKL